RRRAAGVLIDWGCGLACASFGAVLESDTRRRRHRGIHPSARLTVCERPPVANEWPLAETRDVSETRRYRTFGEFYPFYLSEHSNRTCRRLHFVGTTIGLGCVVAALVTCDLRYVLAGLVSGYLLAWVG